MIDTLLRRRKTKDEEEEDENEKEVPFFSYSSLLLLLLCVSYSFDLLRKDDFSVSRKEFFIKYININKAHT